MPLVSREIRTSTMANFGEIFSVESNHSNDDDDDDKSGSFITSDESDSVCVGQRHKPELVWRDGQRSILLCGAHT